MNSRLLKNETTEVLEEILSCLEDSDRYIDEQRKLSIIDNIEIELSRRGLKQYETDRICKSRLFKCLGCGFKGSLFCMDCCGIVADFEGSDKA